MKLRSKAWLAVLVISAALGEAQAQNKDPRDEYYDSRTRHFKLLNDLPRIRRMQKSITRMMEILPPDNENSTDEVVKAFCKTPEMSSPEVNFLEALLLEGKGLNNNTQTIAIAPFEKKEISVLKVNLALQTAAKQMIEMCGKTREKWMLFPKHKLNNIRTIAGQFRDRLAELDSELTLEIAVYNKLHYQIEREQQAWEEQRARLLASQKWQEAQKAKQAPPPPPAPIVVPEAPKFTGICGELEKTLGEEYDQQERALLDYSVHRSTALFVASHYVGELNRDSKFLVEYYQKLKTNKGEFSLDGRHKAAVRKAQNMFERISCDPIDRKFYAYDATKQDFTDLPYLACRWNYFTNSAKGPGMSTYGRWTDRIAIVIANNRLRICSGPSAPMKYVCTEFSLEPKPGTMKASGFHLRPFTEADIATVFSPQFIDFDSRDGVPFSPQYKIKITKPKPMPNKSREAYISAKLAAEGCVVGKASAKVADNAESKSVASPKKSNKTNSAWHEAEKNSAH